MDALCGLCGRQGFRQSPSVSLPPLLQDTLSARKAGPPALGGGQPAARTACPPRPARVLPASVASSASLPSGRYRAGQESLLSDQPTVGASCVWAPPAPAGAMQSCLDLGSTACAPRALATLHLPISHLGAMQPQPPEARGKTTGLSPLPVPGHSSIHRADTGPARPLQALAGTPGAGHLPQQQAGGRTCAPAHGAFWGWGALHLVSVPSMSRASHPRFFTVLGPQDLAT